MFEPGRKSSSLGVVGGTYLLDSHQHLGSIRPPLAVTLAEGAFQNLGGE
jgi:hypothetical protein